MKQNMLFIILPILASEVAHGCNQIALPFTTTTSTPSTTTTLAPTTTTLAPTTTTPASTTTTEIGSTAIPNDFEKVSSFIFLIDGEEHSQQQHLLQQQQQ